jgi:putative transposase
VADQVTARVLSRTDPNVAFDCSSQPPSSRCCDDRLNPPYAAGHYRDTLLAAAIIQSMSRKANCWDNAPMESFFGTLKTELVHQREYPDRDAARRDLFAYIEGYYNRQRIHSAIGYITPDQAEAISA